MKKHTWKKYIPVIVCILLICFYVIEKLSDPGTLLPLNTIEAKDLKQEILEQYADKVKIQYRTINHIQIDCTAEVWDGEDAAEVADIVVDRLGDDAFIQSFAERYQKRCGTEDSLPKTVMLRLHEKGESTPEFVISSSYPFDEWSRVS